MKIRSGFVTTQLAAVLVIIGLCALPARGAEKTSKVAQQGASDKEVSPAEKKLLKSSEQLVEAFDRGDAEAIAQAWLTDGDYVTQEGRHLKGRKEIQAAFKTFFEQSKGAKLRLNVTSVRLVTPELAIIDGVSEVIPSDGGAPSAARYNVVRVKKDGKWMVASVREAHYTPPSNFENLQVVSWLVGDWVDDVKEGEVARVSFRWTDNENFIIGETEVALKQIPVSGATQWIGWDPGKNRFAPGRLLPTEVSAKPPGRTKERNGW